MRGKWPGTFANAFKVWIEANSSQGNVPEEATPAPMTRSRGEPSLPVRSGRNASSTACLTERMDFNTWQIWSLNPSSRSVSGRSSVARADARGRGS
eukprot:9466287-Pyramimonas_sp.AAC.1